MVTHTDPGPSHSPEDDLSTTEAAVLIGLSPSRVRDLISQGRLPAHREGPTWRVRRCDAEAYRDAGPIFKDGRGSHTTTGPAAVWETLEVLAEMDEATSSELALAVDRHPGNVRKYLIILRHRGFVRGRPDGINEITDEGRTFLRTMTKEMRTAS